jgi:thioesterase domain-containing protein
MTPAELQDYLHAHIPLSAAMQVAVEAASPELVVLAAPLAPNINHRDTVFGGSASAVAILSAWCLLHLRLRAEDREARLVIQRNTMDYAQPIAGRFTAHAPAPPAEAWALFTRMFDRRGLARVNTGSTLWFDGREAGRLNGEFVALGPSAAAGRPA